MMSCVSNDVHCVSLSPCLSLRLDGRVCRCVRGLLAGLEVADFFERGEHVDCMLLDIRMPGKTGLEALQEARVKPVYPVFAVTGHVDTEAQEEFRCVQVGLLQ